MLAGAQGKYDVSRQLEGATSAMAIEPIKMLDAASGSLSSADPAQQNGPGARPGPFAGGDSVHSPWSADGSINHAVKQCAVGAFMRE